MRVNSKSVNWGVVSTIKAPAREILRFAAWYLEAGAQRIYVYLDAPNPDAAAALKAHPKCRVILCDDDYWRKRSGRPQAHQSRQTFNATRAYRRTDVDWLAHFDVDEFLVSPRHLAQILTEQPESTQSVRIRPMELLADGDGTAFKDFIPPKNRAEITEKIYPTYGQYLNGGFLSHNAGKVILRTGLPDVQLRIHNGFQDKVQFSSCHELQELRLAHFHARDWPSWLAQYNYRLKHGVYRAELAPNRRRQQGGVNMHELFSMIEAEGGKDGLRHFFDTVIADTPQLRDRLQQHKLLRIAQINADPLVTRHFPFAAPV